MRFGSIAEKTVRTEVRILYTITVNGPTTVMPLLLIGH